MGEFFLPGSATAFFKVNFAQLNPTTGVVDHYGTFLLPDAEVTSGLSVHVKIDPRQRILHSRLHSAGHAIDAAMTRSGYPSTVLKPMKGYHFQDGPYVEFQIQAPLTLSENDLKTLQSQLNENLANIIAENIPTVVASVDKETAGERCGMDVTGYPPVVRLVELANSPCPCGGTHVNGTAELGDIKVTKLKKKKDMLRVSYVVNDV